MYERLLRTFDNLRHFYCLQDHTTSNNKMGKDKHKDGEAATSETNNPQDGRRDSRRDHSRNQEARDATLAQTITETSHKGGGEGSCALPGYSQ